MFGAFLICSGSDGFVQLRLEVTNDIRLLVEYFTEEDQNRK